MLEAQAIFSHARLDSRKALFLVTDGFSNGGDPRSVATALKSEGVTIFTFGVRNGNTAELFDMASIPGEEHSYILDSFEEFVALARRALHRDLSAGVYKPVADSGLCHEVCSSVAQCSCGLHSGQYECLCPPGYYGLGTADQETPCLPCPNGTYISGGVPGDVTMCTPCPDVNHMTLGPASGLHDCVCKRGFIVNGSSCEMVKCPPLKAPKNGLFVRGSCSNVVNAGCGLRCKVGYSLIGSSVRLCQQDGKWSGKSPKCVVKRCPRLQPPNNGVVVCTPKITDEEEFPVDAECKFSCHQGSHLVGSPIRTCLPLARWDGLPTTCKPIKCSALPKVPNGLWQPEECVSNKKLPFGQTCQLSCNLGFEREGPETRECVFKGSWTHKKEISKCIDSMPPVIKCPENITTTTDPGASYASVSWIEPQAQDNSNQSVLIWSDPPAELPMKLPIGHTFISYVATDSSYNQGVCEFSITVIDNEAPVVENCESPPPVYVSEVSNTNMSWTEPSFSDNSMRELYINTSHVLKDLPVGTTKVTFTAYDPSSNSISCTINYTLIDSGCVGLPPHVISNCSTDTCILSCEEGYMFISFNSTIEVPYPCVQSDLPDCAETEEPNELVQEGVLSITPISADLCSNADVVNKVKSSVELSLAEICNNASTGCNVGVEANCEDVLESAEEESNMIVNRRKRSVKNKNINLNFKLTGQFDEEVSRGKLSSIAQNTTLFQNISKKKHAKLSLKPIVGDCSPGTIFKLSRCVKCPAGTSWKEVALPQKVDGKSMFKEACVACSFGFYQPLSAQLECLSCPNNTSTRRLRSKHFHSCRDICPAGTHGSTKGRHGAGRLGVKPCISCPIGWYQPQKGALSCIRCANNMSTSRRRTVSANECQESSPCQLNKCHNGGTCVAEGIFVSCSCVPGFIGSRCEFKKNECTSMPCLNGGTCSSTDSGYACTCPEGFTGKECQIDIDECASNPCQNGGECLDLINSFTCNCPPAFQGDLCEVNADDCLPQPCAEGSTCVDNVGNYTCVCQPNYSGRHCEQDPCIDTNFCQHNGTCHLGENPTQQSYWCQCEPGFTGPQCESEIDFCLSSPCQHDSICINQPLTMQVICICRPGYVGKYCESYMPSNFTLFFPTSGTSNYVKVKGPYADMEEVTVCLWMKTDDLFNYGTILSYATIVHDNTLTLTDYNGLVLYVNGERVVTDVTANDGVWHHVCVEWFSKNGQWTLYKDGLLVDGGVGLANNTVVPGGGILILGQDQDHIGGGFNAAESLVGFLTQVNIWNYSLGADRIDRLANSCQEQDEGSTISWGQFRSGVKGIVQIRQPTLCQGCKDLSAPPFTTIQISEARDLAIYTCDPGYSFKYYISNEVTKLERKCLIHGDWKGKSPVCTKRSCGFPGYFPAGWIVGRSFVYQSQIEYVCQPGFRLVGNKVRTCMADGSWSGEIPSCQGGECPDIYTPNHGMMWGSFEETYRLEFECMSGFELHGSEIITCLPNNTWNPAPPDCLPIVCKYSSNVTDTHLLSGQVFLEDGSYYLDSQVQIKCHKGFRSSQESYNITCTHSGWSPPLDDLQCTEILCPDLKIINGSAATNFSKPGSQARIDCDQGFVLKGSSVLVCLDSGVWNSTSSCVKITCPAISTDHLALPSSEFGKVATIQCPAGMLLLVGGQPVENQELRWECSADGQWKNLTKALVDPNILNCVAKTNKTCSPPEAPQFGYIVPDSHNTSVYQEGFKLEVQCRQGYLLQGSNIVMCKQDGSWTNTTLCIAVDCGQPSLPPLTQLALMSNTLYGSMARLKCEGGYQAYGDMTLRCQANKKWSRFRGRCVRISCGKPILEEGVSVIGSAYLYKEKLKIICPSGLTVDGDEYITCEKNGKWSTVPKCINN